MNVNRRRAAAGIVAIVAAGSVVLLAEAVDAVRFPLDDRFVGEAEIAHERFECLEAAMAALPDVPTYVEPVDDGIGALGYQRAIELGFGSVDFVTDPDDAEQVVAIIPVPIGTDTCRDLDVVVVEP